MISRGALDNLVNKSAKLSEEFTNGAVGGRGSRSFLTGPMRRDQMQNASDPPGPKFKTSDVDAPDSRGPILRGQNLDPERPLTLKYRGG